MTWERTLADLVEERTGIALQPRQLRADVRRRIAQRIEALELRGPEAWVWHLARSSPDDPEFAWLVGAVTVGYSYFFRDAEQLAIAIEVLVELDRGRRGRSHNQVWCAGCATGQEPWSLAILAQQARLPVQILGTDLNPQFLEAAKAGVYPVKALDQVPDALRPGLVGVEGGVRVHDGLRSSVRFANHNLVGPGPMPFAPDGGRFDLILCRNVFIYFSDAVRQRVATRLARALEPRGWLFFGPGESLEGLDVPVVPRSWGRRLGYNPALPGAPIRAVTPMPAPDRRVPAVISKAVDSQGPELEVLAARAGSDPDGVELALATLARTQGSVRAWTALAHLRIRMHRFGPALQACEQGSAADPLAPEPHLAAGVVHRKRGDLTAAERALRHALFLDAECWPAAWLLAGVHGRQGRDRERRAAHAQALAALERARDPDSPRTRPLPGFGVEALELDLLRARIEAELPST